ncbi:MAG: hypothetical protein JJ974_01690 [Phycisphaerales bacterium]|nr:hypothetical protein [Phycisphaerales bacterium]
MKFTSRSAVLSTLMCAVSLAHAADEWYLCTTDLKITSIRSPSIQNGILTYLDQRGMNQSKPIDETFFVLPSQQPEDWAYEFDGSGEHAILTLTDQQRLPVLIQESDDLDLIRFITPFESAARSVPIESIDHLLVGWIPTGSRVESDDDVIRLNSNDLITGFVESISDVVVIETDEAVRSFPIDQVNLIQLAIDPIEIDGVYIHLDRHIRLAVSDLITTDSDIGSGTVLQLNRAHPERPPSRPTRFTFDSQRFAGVDVEHTRLDMVPLASRLPQSVNPTGSRSWTPDPQTHASSIPNSGLDDLDLRAPSEIRYSLDRNTTRFACNAELVVGPWSDCILQILAGSSSSEPSVIHSVRLNSETSGSQILIDLPDTADELIIRIDPGINGPIQDRIILRQPRLLIEEISPKFE